MSKKWEPGFPRTGLSGAATDYPKTVFSVRQWKLWTGSRFLLKKSSPGLGNMNGVGASCMFDYGAQLCTYMSVTKLQKLCLSQNKEFQTIAEFEARKAHEQPTDLGTRLTLAITPFSCLCQWFRIRLWSTLRQLCQGVRALRKVLRSDAGIALHSSDKYTLRLKASKIRVILEHIKPHSATLLWLRF